MAPKYKPGIHYTSSNDPDMVVCYTEGHVNDQDAWVPPVNNRILSRLAELKGKKVIGWKKCSWYDKRIKARHHALVELEIAARTQRVQPKNYKCRAASARVLSIHECVPGKGNRYNHWKMTGKKLRMSRSHHDPDFVYRVGERVKPVRPWAYEYANTFKTIKKRTGSATFVRDHRECATGIHFFLTQKEALRYLL